MFSNVKTCLQRPGLYVVEPTLLRVSKAVRNEALKPYVWRLRRDLSGVHGQLESFEAQHRSRGLKESSPLRWHSTELKFLAEMLELEIERIEEEIGRNRMLQQEKK